LTPTEGFFQGSSTVGLRAFASFADEQIPITCSYENDKKHVHAAEQVTSKIGLIGPLLEQLGIWRGDSAGIAFYEVDVDIPCPYRIALSMIDVSARYMCLDPPDK
jgi:hypothetical protein